MRHISEKESYVTNSLFTLYQSFLPPPQALLYTMCGNEFPKRSHHADIWGAGCCIYRFLKNANPFNFDCEKPNVAMTRLAWATRTMRPVMAEHTSMTEAYIELVRKLVVPVPGLEQGGVREATRLQEAADMDVFGNFDFSTLWLSQSY